MSFSELLKQCRKQQGMSQAELASKLGVTQQAVGKWESGKSSPDPTTVARIAEILSTTADFLLDTSFTYELGLIAKLLQKVRQQFTLEGHNAELWDETARRFEQVDPLPLELLPADSMLCEFYGSRT